MQVVAAKTEGHCFPADPELLATAACAGSAPSGQVQLSGRGEREV